MRARLALAVPLFWPSLALGDERLDPGLTLASDGASVQLRLSPFGFEIHDGDGTVVLASTRGGGAYGSPAATLDDPEFVNQVLAGWEG